MSSLDRSVCNFNLCNRIKDLPQQLDDFADLQYIVNTTKTENGYDVVFLSCKETILSFHNIKTLFLKE